MTTEDLIFLVYSKPEVWDQNSKYYSSKDMKLKAWNYIGEKLNISANVAKVRWTSLRDLFRRELKKIIKMSKMTGDPESYIPRWKHFKSMLFLKDQIVKDDEVELPSLAFDESFSKHYPQTILDEDSKGEEYYTEYPESLTPVVTNGISQSSDSKRLSEDTSIGYGRCGKPNKRRRMEEPSYVDSSELFPPFVSNDFADTDEDYHFIMSLLPSFRRVRSERKTAFKMRVLQLIMEEENVPL